MPKEKSAQKLALSTELLDGSGGTQKEKETRSAEKKKSRSATSSSSTHKLAVQEVRKSAAESFDDVDPARVYLTPEKIRSKSLTSAFQKGESSEKNEPWQNQTNERVKSNKQLEKAGMEGRRSGNAISTLKAEDKLKGMQDTKKSGQQDGSNGGKSGNAGSHPSSDTSSIIPSDNAQMNTSASLVPNSAKTPAALSTQAGVKTVMVKSTVGFDRSRNIRLQVERALKEHKVFSCVGVYPAIRKALQKRGWIEKNGTIGAARSATANAAPAKPGSEEESDQAWMNRVLRDYPPDFIWVIRRDNIDWRSLHKDQLINRYPKAFFTTKVGIAACIQNMHWFNEIGVAETLFPRCYRLCMDEEKSAFIDDYRLSACIGLLKWVVGAYEKEGEVGVMDQSSRVVSLAVDFAIRQVNNYVRMRRHEDIDWLMPPTFMGQHWDVFLNQYYTVVHLKGKLAPSDSQDSGKTKYEASKKALQRLIPFWSQYHIDGMSNIWICKPGARSRGRGIVIMNQLDKILDLLAQTNCRESNWVVQKYIERPMLIYNTKFDIRQWFIITDWSPLTVWFYKESYVRFCTKPFSLEDFHESVHLCNNAIQCRYQNSELRDSALPDENMWDCYTFQAYLKTIGKMELWDTMIYPGMKQGIIGVLLASQETVDVRKNCFELYGADFMLSEDLRPWLIEINSCPCMAPSTSVTARMCAQCLEDAIKVTVDRRDDKNADTGNFELIYKQGVPNVAVQPFNGIELVVQGKKLTRDVDWPSIMTKYNSKRGSVTGSSNRLIRSQQNQESGLTFMDLVQRLRYRDPEKQETEDLYKAKSSVTKPTNSLPNSLVTTKRLTPKSTPELTKFPPQAAIPASSTADAAATLGPLSSTQNEKNSYPNTILKPLNGNTTITIGRSPSPETRQDTTRQDIGGQIKDVLQNLHANPRLISESLPGSSSQRASLAYDFGLSPRSVNQTRRSATTTPSRRSRQSLSRNRSRPSSRPATTTRLLTNSPSSKKSNADFENRNFGSRPRTPAGTEISLSTFLKNSATVADLVRLRRDAERERATLSMSSPPPLVRDSSGPLDLSRFRDNSVGRRPRTNNGEMSTASLGQNTSGRMRPNARTNSLMNVSSCNHRSTNSTVGSNFHCNNQPARFPQTKRSRRHADRPSKASFGKMISKVYSIHRINTLPDEFEDPTALQALEPDQNFHPVQVITVVTDANHNRETALTDSASSEQTSWKTNPNAENVSDRTKISHCNSLSGCENGSFSDASNSSASGDAEPFRIKFSVENRKHMIIDSGQISRTQQLPNSNMRINYHTNQPCYRIALEHPQNSVLSKRPLASFPIKTVNINL